MSSIAEEGLLERLRFGDQSAFTELVILFRKKVLNICYRFLLDKDDAEDLSQDVFVEVFRSLRHYRADCSLNTWIYRIAITKSLDEIKRRKRKKRLAALTVRLGLTDLSEWLSAPGSADSQILHRERMTEMMQALDTLPDNQRIAFTLSKIEGYSNIEIAAIMNTSISAVESLSHRAKKKVAEELKKILKNQ